MKLIPQDDYYLWYCDWCDSCNRTLWTRVETGQVQCGACQKPIAIPHDASVERHSSIV
jgi:ribosomal protein L37AE/L43A